MALSEIAVRKAKPRPKSYKMFDGGGLYLHVQTSGSKLWRMKYRYFAKEKLLSLGQYPVVTMAEARVAREKAKKLLFDGTDPGVQKRLDKITAETAHRNTFGLVAEEYIERLEDMERAEPTLKKNRWLLEQIAAPLANRPIKEINAAEVLQLLKQIEKSGRRETARKLRGTISSVFRLAIMTLRAENDPTLALRGALLPPKRQGRPAIIDEKEFGTLLRTLDEHPGWESIKAAMHLQILTCLRPGEVRGARRAEFNLEAATWRIPAERMKMRKPHDVPLSRQSMKILEGIWHNSEDSELVFPSARSKTQPLSENAFNSVLRRMGYEKHEVTSHGFRVTASTILNSRGHEPDVIEALLAHQEPNAIRRAYNRATYWPQRIELLQIWANLLDDFREMSRGAKAQTTDEGRTRPLDDFSASRPIHWFGDD